MSQTANEIVFIYLEEIINGKPCVLLIKKADWGLPSNLEKETGIPRQHVEVGKTRKDLFYYENRNKEKGTVLYLNWVVRAQLRVPPRSLILRPKKDCGIERIRWFPLDNLPKTSNGAFTEDGLCKSHIKKIRRAHRLWGYA